MVSRWNYDSPEQERQDHSRLANQVRIQAPELINEWTSLNPLEREKAIEHLRFYGVAVPMMRESQLSASKRLSS